VNIKIPAMKTVKRITNSELQKYWLHLDGFITMKILPQGHKPNYQIYELWNLNIVSHEYRHIFTACILLCTTNIWLSKVSLNTTKNGSTINQYFID
jgi:hypothetical protein